MFLIFWKFKFIFVLNLFLNFDKNHMLHLNFKNYSYILVVNSNNQLHRGLINRPCGKVGGCQIRFSGLSDLFEECLSWMLVGGLLLFLIVLKIAQKARLLFLSIFFYFEKSV